MAWVMTTTTATTTTGLAAVGPAWRDCYKHYIAGVWWVIGHTGSSTTFAYYSWVQRLVSVGFEERGIRD
ncbi:hypothetical protein BBK36DRAFT_1155756 [Trichoderma citrinoviride]|uniref:Uncharacterized protein n=1 Tax=Trichoderma citrinoviride TaxID=58853 RepID=A0A2T4BNT0_9HYPO|nr:hypothetical protein BBK36DRAFT_1155756 [Trichoderma citrinoviride]PTB70975.1 hypothetical protein BBK36DRAFT_1155756 [Trichoderma citrinoviride]